MSGFLYKTEYKINDYITVKIPTVGEIIKNEDEYYESISLIVSTPYDMMVQLDDAGIDFTNITDWDLFCLLFKDLQNRDLSLIFGDINLKDFETAINKQNGNIILLNQKTGAVIDRAIHDKICRFLRQILCIEKNTKKPANEEAKKFMIERARRRQKRNKRKSNQSQLENFIVALVNTSEFSYDYSSTLGLTIYQFYASLHQIVKKVKFDNLMIGCYAGTVSVKELDQKELNWISN
ncbi:MAG: hypothetical protein IKI94_01570 [Ruminococcus sp.]|nr:hypothetical protein [Ruminococcus sp.]